ncbi:MAG: SRPBCC family protein [Chloroflexota bacterium]|nr:SRPBCC family protein [Chloroflexota bacterium]
MKFACTVDINSTPEKVFSWIDNPEKAKLWITSVSETEYLHQTPEIIGTTFRETVEENGRGTELHGVITDYRPNRLIAFHLSGDYNIVDVEYRLAEINGLTRLTLDSNIRFRSFTKVIMLITGPLFKRRIRRQLQEEFARLKKLCEQDAPQSAIIGSK